MRTDIREVLGEEADSLLGHECKTIERDQLVAPGPRLHRPGARSRAIGRSPVLRNLEAMFDHGRLGGTGYLSILPVDQGIEHSAAASFAKNPVYFDPASDRRARHRGASATPSPRRSASSGSSPAATRTRSPSS